MPRKHRRWVTIYHDIDPETKTLKPYLRLTPEFMDLKAAGRPHGLMIGGDFRDTLAEAERFADSVEAFLDAMIEAYNKTR